MIAHIVNRGRSAAVNNARPARVERQVRERAGGAGMARPVVSFLQTRINELWSLDDHHHEFIGQFSETGQRFEVPGGTAARRRKFAGGYDLFAQHFRGAVNELKTVARAPLEAPGVKTAGELAVP